MLHSGFALVALLLASPLFADTISSVLAYDRAFTPPSDAMHDQILVRFARVPPLVRRRATK